MGLKIMRWIWLLLLTLSFALPARAQTTNANKSEEDIKKEVLMAEEEQDQAVATGDIKTLESIWADNLVYTTPNGELLTKAEHLAEFQSGIRKIESMKHDDFNVRVYSKTVAVLTGRSTSVLRYKGEVSDGPRRFTNVFVKMDGRWQLVSHHVTNVAK
jgi:ketosteroid isomerase-like protein